MHLISFRWKTLKHRAGLSERDECARTSGVLVVLWWSSRETWGERKTFD